VGRGWAFSASLFEEQAIPRGRCPSRHGSSWQEDESYYFYVSGVSYSLMIGGGIDPNMKALRFNQATVKPVFVGDDWADQAVAVLKRASVGTVPSPKLKDGLKPKT
jgi:hypothetical protein